MRWSATFCKTGGGTQTIPIKRRKKRAKKNSVSVLKDFFFVSWHQEKWKYEMAQNILSAGDLEGFPNQGKFERGDWVGSSVEENRGLPELSSAAKFIGGKTQASHLRIVRFTLMALCAHLLSERRNRVACVWEEIAYHFHWLLLLRIEGTKCTMVSTGPNVVSHGYIYMITWFTSYQGYTHFGLQHTVVYTSVNTSVITSVKTSVSLVTDEVECNLL